MRRAAAALALALKLAVESAARADVAPPPTLAPGAADRLLATLTDAELRAFLRAELEGEDRGPLPTEAAAGAAFAQAGLRLSTMAATATERLSLWTAAVADLPARGSDVAARLALARRGTAGMIAACLGVAAAGRGSAAALARTAAALRRSLVPARPLG